MIDLREELNILTDDTFDIYILRHLTEKKCHCWREQQTADLNCPDCEGLGWYFDEKLVKCKVFPYQSAGLNIAYEGSPGLLYSNIYVAYIPKDQIEDGELNLNDRLFRIENFEKSEIDDFMNGELPIKRIKRYQIVELFDFHEEHNKLEFYKIFIKTELV